MSKDKKNKDELSTRYARIVFLLFLLCIIFGGIGVCISWSLKDCDQTFRDNVITIYASFVSSFLALFGVIISILSAKAMDLNKRKYSHEPEFYLPHKYDLSKAENYCLSLGEYPKIVIPNNRIFFQNTDKTEFMIEEVSIFGKDDIALICGTMNQYVGKGVLFFLSFYCEKDIGKISIKTKSTDGYEYLFEVDMDKKIVRKI